ncbi:MAG: alpha/beta fold hydrolase [Promethearchaeota archaeon]
MPNIIFIHGLESSGKGFKGQLFKRVLPGCFTPNFIGSLEERMEQLILILKDKEPWIIIGSSYGGLMGSLYTLKFPFKVSLLILLAPALTFPELNTTKFQSIDVPVVIYHGKKDNVVPMKNSRAIAEQLFFNLKYNVVDDDHMLHSTVEKIDWKKLITATKKHVKY